MLKNYNKLVTNNRTLVKYRIFDLFVELHATHADLVEQQTF